MDNMLLNLLYFGIIFIIVLLVYIFIIRKRRLKKLNYNNMGEVSLLLIKYKLDVKKINLNQILIVTSFLNAFIIAFVCMIISALPLKLIWQMMIGFVLLFGLVYASYEIYGRSLIKKGWQKDLKKGRKINV